MIALDWDGTSLRLVEREVPSELGTCEALVRVHLAGVCNTDLEIVRGYMGFRGTPGHEIVGTVAAGPPEWLGARVAAEINFGCGACEWCGRHLARHCPKRTVMGILGADGGFAEYVVVPTTNLHRVPDTIPDHRAVFIEPLAAAFEILEQVTVQPGAKCTVFGDGKLGLLAAQVLANANARVTLVGKHPTKLAALRARDIRTVQLPDWDGAAAELVIDATGTASGFARAVAATLPRGTLVLKSTVAQYPPIDLAPLVINEISVVGSRCGPFEPALHALATGAIEVDALLTATLPLSRAVEAFERAATKGSLKIAIDPRGG